VRAGRHLIGSNKLSAQKIIRNLDLGIRDWGLPIVYYLCAPKNKKLK